MSKDDFIKLGGSWKYFSDRIVNFRSILGGFYKKEQLLEVYGLKKDFYNKVSELIKIDQKKIIKININFAEESDLNKHPYISYTDANKIISYRNLSGSYKDLNQLTTNNLISKDTFKKISPYLKVK